MDGNEATLGAAGSGDPALQIKAGSGADGERAVADDVALDF